MGGGLEFGWRGNAALPGIDSVGQNYRFAHARKTDYAFAIQTPYKKELSPKQRDELLAALQARFDANMARHPGLVWAKVQARLEAKPDKLWSLAEMERTGGEPDVVHKPRSNLFGWRGQFMPEFVA